MLYQEPPPVSNKANGVGRGRIRSIMPTAACRYTTTTAFLDQRGGVHEHSSQAPPFLIRDYPFIGMPMDAYSKNKQRCGQTFRELSPATPTRYSTTARLILFYVTSGATTGRAETVACLPIHRQRRERFGAPTATACSWWWTGDGLHENDRSVPTNNKISSIS